MSDIVWGFTTYEEHRVNPGEIPNTRSALHQLTGQQVRYLHENTSSTLATHTLQCPLSLVDMKRTQGKNKNKHCRHCGCSNHTAVRWHSVGNNYQLAADVNPESEDVCDACYRANLVLIGKQDVRVTS